MRSLLFLAGEYHYKYSKKLSPDGTCFIKDGLFEELLEEGIWKDYHENGNLAAEGYYHKGKEVEIWKWYDEEGNYEGEDDYGE